MLLKLVCSSIPRSRTCLYSAEERVRKFTAALGNNDLNNGIYKGIILKAMSEWTW